MRRLLAAIGAAACWSGCGAPTQFPDPPDMEPLHELYTTPRGEVNSKTISEVFAGFPARQNEIETAGRLSFVADVAAQVDSSEGLGGDRSDESLRIFAEVTYACRGPAGEENRDPSRYGSLELNALASLDGLEPVLWGEARDCSERSMRESFELDGVLSLRMGKRRKGKANVLVDFEGTVRAGGDTADGPFDFLREQDGTLVTRHTLSNGHVLFASSGLPSILEVRDRSTVWRCSLEPDVCVDAQSGRVLARELSVRP